MEEKEERVSYYRDKSSSVIENMKTAIDKIEHIITDEIDPDIKDDKLFNVLKAKRQATEDTIYYLKKIDEMQNELDGTTDNEEEVVMNRAKQFAEKNKA